MRNGQPRKSKLQEAMARYTMRNGGIRKIDEVALDFSNLVPHLIYLDIVFEFTPGHVTKVHASVPQEHVARSYGWDDLWEGKPAVQQASCWVIIML